MLQQIFKSLSIILIVAASAAGLFTLMFDWDVSKFTIGTLIAIVLQFAGKWYIDKIQDASIETIAAEMPLPSIKMQIECAFCKKVNIIDYNLAQEEFACDTCNNVNAIYGKFFAARKVTPMDAVLTPDIPEVG